MHEGDGPCLNQYCMSTDNTENMHDMPFLDNKLLLMKWQTVCKLVVDSSSKSSEIDLPF